MITIGGEHYFEPKHVFGKSHNYLNNLIKEVSDDFCVSFTFGGYYSLLAIIDDLKPRLDPDSVILLPSYLCPTMLKPFKLRGINYKFYTIDQDLYVDIESIRLRLDENVKAILFIDYFGSSQKKRLEPILKIIKENNIEIIQDIVQCLDINKDFFFGDYIFNSFRKFFPYEGSIIISKNKMNISYSTTNYIYLVYKRIGQIIRYFHIKHNLFPSKFFLFFLKKAEDNYYKSNVLRMPKINKWLLNKYDIDFIKKRHVFYFKRLLNNFNNLVPDLLKREDFIPLGFIMRLNSRDIVRQELFGYNIFAPIHWIVSNEIIEEGFVDSVSLSSKIITIPIINLTDIKFEYLFDKLNKIKANENLS